MKILVVLFLAGGLVWGQPNNILASLPTGLWYITKTAAGVATLEGVDVPGVGVKLQRDAATGKMQLVADPAFGTKIAWGEELAQLAPDKWKLANAPTAGKIFIWQVPIAGAWVFMTEGFTILGQVVTLSAAPAIGTRVYASYLF